MIMMTATTAATSSGSTTQGIPPVLPPSATEKTYRIASIIFLILASIFGVFTIGVGSAGIGLLPLILPISVPTAVAISTTLSAATAVAGLFFGLPNDAANEAEDATIHLSDETGEEEEVVDSDPLTEVEHRDDKKSTSSKPPVDTSSEAATSMRLPSSLETTGTDDKKPDLKESGPLQSAKQHHKRRRHKGKEKAVAPAVDLPESKPILPPTPPIGISNSGNNCWVNALLQFCKAVPMLRDSCNSKAYHTLLRRIDQLLLLEEIGQRDGKTTSRADSQKLRLALNKRVLDDRFAHGQHDAAEPLGFILDRLPKELIPRVYHSFLCSNPAGQKWSTRRELVNSPLILLPILKSASSDPTFLELFNSYFTLLPEQSPPCDVKNPVTGAHDGILQGEHYQFERVPNDLIISFRRFRNRLQPPPGQQQTETDGGAATFHEGVPQPAPAPSASGPADTKSAETGEAAAATSAQATQKDPQKAPEAQVSWFWQLIYWLFGDDRPHGPPFEAAKDETPITFPEDLRFVLNPDFVEKSESAEAEKALYAYEVDAFISHRGNSIESGHYVAYVRSDDGTWFLCNDSVVTPKTLQEIRDAISESYIVHFRRVSQ